MVKLLHSGYYTGYKIIQTIIDILINSVKSLNKLLKDIFRHHITEANSANMTVGQKEYLNIDLMRALNLCIET